MRGAIIGDVVGSRFEFDRSPKIKEFELFDQECSYTDDSIMTVAVADAIMAAPHDATESEFKTLLVVAFRKWYSLFPSAGHGLGGWGCMFYRWLEGEVSGPYGSFGNGSAMRVSPVGWAYNSLARTREVARWSAEITHNHPEGVKGAEAVATIIYLLRNGQKDKDYIRQYITDEFGYDLSRTCDEIRPGYRHVETCQETVPEAITAFLEGDSFEDVLRTAVSLGGDCDTLTDIACAMAEACYPIPHGIWNTCEHFVDERMLTVVKHFSEYLKLVQK